MKAATHLRWRVRVPTLVFDERLQPRQRVVPLLGYVIEIFPSVLDRLRLKLEQAFAPDADATHDACVRQDSQVFRHRLPREIGAYGQTRNGLRFAMAEIGRAHV